MARKHDWTFVVALAACTPDRAPIPPAEPATGSPPPSAVVATDGAPTSAAGSATPASTRDPMPPLASLVRLTIKQGPGGPFRPKCGAIESDLSIDLKTNAFTWLTCEPKPGDPAGKAPLRPFKQGKLMPEQRKAIDDAYAGLTHGPARGCGADGGTLRLELAHADGRTESFLDDRWGCGQPPPEAIEGLGDFTSRVFAQVAARMP
jgi:hypothetical protein